MQLHRVLLRGSGAPGSAGPESRPALAGKRYGGVSGACLSPPRPHDLSEVWAWHRGSRSRPRRVHPAPGKAERETSQPLSCPRWGRAFRPADVAAAPKAARHPSAGRPPPLSLQLQRAPSSAPRCGAGAGELPSAAAGTVGTAGTSPLPLEDRKPGVSDLFSRTWGNCVGARRGLCGGRQAGSARGERSQCSSCCVHPPSSDPRSAEEKEGPAGPLTRPGVYCTAGKGREGRLRPAATSCPRGASRDGAKAGVRPHTASSGHGPRQRPGAGRAASALPLCRALGRARAPERTFPFSHWC